MNDRSKFQQFYEIINRIPQGKVATYGQVATIAGYPGQARQVGYALNATPCDVDIPWHRVINAKGEISSRSNPIGEDLQKQLLIDEGIEFDTKNRISLKNYQWKPNTN